MIQQTTDDSNLAHPEFLVTQFMKSLMKKLNPETGVFPSTGIYKDSSIKHPLTLHYLNKMQTAV